MALIVEDGSIVAGAEAYASVAAADAYFSARGYTRWTSLLEAEKEQALRRAADYMGATYGLRWAGSRVSSEQAMDFPRQDIQRRDTVDDTYWPSDSIPEIVVKANCELAYRAAQGELAPDIPIGGGVIRRQKVDVIETEYERNAHQTIAVYRAVGNLLSPLFKAAGGGLMR